MATPILGATELTSAQAIPETRLNQTIRLLEQGAGAFSVKNQTNTPPGSPADGDSYIVTATATGAWAGWELSIAYYQTGTGWLRIQPREGMLAWDQTANTLYRYDTTWGTLEATAIEVWSGTAIGKFISPKIAHDAQVPGTLTSGTTITPDFNAAANFTLTLAHNATLANPSNLQAGDSGAIAITQDGTGSRTMAYGSQWKFPGGAPVLSTAAGAIDLLTYWAPTTGVIYATLTKAYSS